MSTSPDRFRLAWVLGNGPSLPSANVLNALRNEFTVGVNRIAKSGFIPHVTMWFDPMNRSNPDDWALTLEHESETVFVATDKCEQKPNCHYALHLVGAPSPDRKVAKPWEMLIDGTVGAAAVRWCFSLGFERVALLGFSSSQELDMGQAHFFPDDDGVRRQDRKRLAENYRSQREALEQDFGDRLVDGDGQRLDGQWTTETVRDFLHQKLQAVRTSRPIKGRPE